MKIMDAQCHKLPVRGFGWFENTPQFNKDFIKNYNEDNYEEYFFFEVDVQYPKNFHDLHNDLQILPQRMKIEKVLKLVANFTDEKEYVSTKSCSLVLATIVNISGKSMADK